jgi:hypothetical protein
MKALTLIFTFVLSGCMTQNFRPTHDQLNVNVRIVARQADFPDVCQRHGAIRGCYVYHTNTIWALGYMVGGKIIPEMKTLGHELQHMLHVRNPKIPDPDKGRR